MGKKKEQQELETHLLREIVEPRVLQFNKYILYKKPTTAPRELLKHYSGKKSSFATLQMLQC